MTLSLAFLPPVIPQLSLLLCFGLSVTLVQAQSSSNLTPSTVTETGARPVPRDINSLAPNIVRSAPQVNAPKLSPVFFPAAIPALNAPLPPAPAVRDSIWNDLAPHANELFFAPLGTRLSTGELSRRFRQRFDAYVDARTAALAQLRAALQLPVSERTGALAGITPTLDEQLRTLATTANELRRELYRGSLLIPDTDWNAYRNWRLGGESKRSAQELLHDEFSVMRAAIFYQEGLSLNQRQLLREIALELSEAIGDRATPALDSFEPAQVIFFLPHGSRFTVPAGLPPALMAQIDQLTAIKSELKRELREALFALDAQSEGKREKQLVELAAKQEPLFAQLEKSAEEIRGALAAFPASEQPAVRPAFPAELVARVNRYLQDKADLQRAAQQMQEQPSPKGKATASAAQTRKALTDFEEKNQARLAALASEARAIRTEVARASVANGAPAKTVDALLADFMEAFKQQQLKALYQEYFTAVLEPGLSAPQRQLLFDAALAALNLPGVKDWQAVPE